MNSDRGRISIDLCKIHRYDDLAVDLREKLSRLRAASPPVTSSRTVHLDESIEPFEAVRTDLVQQNGSINTARAEIGDLISGTHRQSAEGQCFVAESIFPLDHVHAGIAVSDILDQAGASFALLTGDPRLRDLDLRRTILIDTETTGLAGGTGTYAFLIGLGYFADGAFRIDQFFMRHPGHERAMLQAVGETLSQFDAVVSFNGKCFDWPLIETRHTYHRLPLKPRTPMHLDLLFPSRRLFRRRLSSCSLGSLEQSVLGLPGRVDDVPGWLIPQIYFDFLHYEDPWPLVPVFHHNRRDILSMLSLATRMSRHVTDPEDAMISEASDLFSLGRLLDDAGNIEAALVQYERALAAHSARNPSTDRQHSKSNSSTEQHEILTRIANAYKRLKRSDRASLLWETLIANGVNCTHPYVELAKHREHKQGDFLSAVRLTEDALILHKTLRTHIPHGRYEMEQMMLRHRLFRLKEKMSRNSGTDSTIATD